VNEFVVSVTCTKLRDKKQKSTFLFTKLIFNFIHIGKKISLFIKGIIVFISCCLLTKLKFMYMDKRLYFVFMYNYFQFSFYILQ